MQEFRMQEFRRQASRMANLNFSDLALIRAAEAEKAALAVDAEIARHFHVSRPFVTRQREHNPLWHEQLEVRWRTETFPPLAARLQIENLKKERLTESCSRKRLGDLERTLAEMFPPASEMFPPEPYVPRTWLERQVDFFWHLFCRPDVWIIITALLMFWVGMSHIEALAGPGQP